MKKAQKQTSQEYGLSASFLDLKFVQKAPQNAITLLASCKRQLTVILCADTPCSHKRVVAWHKEPSRCHSDMCIPVICVFPPIWLPVKCVSPTPTPHSNPSKKLSVLFLLFLWILRIIVKGISNDSRLWATLSTKEKRFETKQTQSCFWRTWRVRTSSWAAMLM